MIIPPANGPRSLTVHDAVAPFCALIVTTVPIGRVRWAHVPGGAASYQVAPPDWLRPEGAGADEPDPPDPEERGAGFGVDAGLAAAAFTVVVVRRTGAGVVVTRADARRARYAVVATVDGGDGVVVGTSVVGGGASGCTPSSPAGSDVDGPRVATASTPDGELPDETETGPEFINASAGPPAIAAHSATGTARRAFLNPRVVRTPPLLQNAGAARPPLPVWKRSQRRLRLERRRT